MWRVEKVSRSREEKNFLICRVPKENTRQKNLFAECQIKTLGKVLTAGTLVDGRHTWRSFAVCLFFAECLVVVCRVFYFLHSVNKFFCRVHLFCRVFTCGHSVKILFAECPKECTRQTTRHSAYILFPVVWEVLKLICTSSREHCCVGLEIFGSSINIIG